MVFAVGDEIAQPFKLPAALRRQIVGGGFDVGGDFFDRFGVEEIGDGRYSPSSPRTASGRGSVNRRSYRRTVAGTACSAESQWITPFTFRPSGFLPKVS